MGRIATVAPLLALLVVVTIAGTAVPAQKADLEGAWIVTSESGDHQRGLVIFTERNYSMMFVSSDEARAEYSGETITDAETIKAYNSFTANSGRYTLDGDKLTFEAYMAKNPNYMAGWPENDRTITIKVDGDRLTWTWEDGRTMTLRRPG